MKKDQNFMERFAEWATRATGSSAAFVVAVLIVIVWAASKPLFKDFDTWQLVINTGTTIITFLMVFLIQKSQNKDSRAVHLKLNELIAAHEGASNRMVNIEDLSEKELAQIRQFYVHLSELAKTEKSLGCTHTFDAAEENHSKKTERDKNYIKRLNERRNQSNPSSKS